MEWMLTNWYVLIGFFIVLVGVFSFSELGIICVLFGAGIMLFKLNILFASMIVLTIIFYLIMFMLIKHYHKD